MSEKQGKEGELSFPRQLDLLDDSHLSDARRSRESADPVLLSEVIRVVAVSNTRLKEEKKEE